MSLHSVVAVGRYQETGQDRSVFSSFVSIIHISQLCSRAMLGTVWENEIKVGICPVSF